MLDRVVDTLALCAELEFRPNCLCRSLRSINFNDSPSTAPVFGISWLLFETTTLALLAVLTAVLTLLLLGDCDGVVVLPALTESLRFLRSFWVIPSDCSNEAISMPEKETVELLLGVLSDMVYACMLVIMRSISMSIGRTGDLCAIILYMLKIHDNLYVFSA